MAGLLRCLYVDSVFKNFYGTVYKPWIFKGQADGVDRAAGHASAASLAVVGDVRPALLHGNLMGKTFIRASTASNAFFLVNNNSKPF